MDEAAVRGHCTRRRPAGVVVHYCIPEHPALTSITLHLHFFALHYITSILQHRLILYCIDLNLQSQARNPFCGVSSVILGSSTPGKFLGLREFSYLQGNFQAPGHACLQGDFQAPGHFDTSPGKFSDPRGQGACQSQEQKLQGLSA